MWCVASAPIVPLARDLDAALGMPRGELAVHFRKLSTPLPTTPLPSRAASAFFPQGALPLSRPPFSISSRTRVSSAHRPCRSYSLRTCLRAFPHLRHVPPCSTPLPPHGHRCNGTCLPKTQKNEHRSLGSGARVGLLIGRKRPVFLMFQKPQPNKTERTSCAKRMRMNMARG